MFPKAIIKILFFFSKKNYNKQHKRLNSKFVESKEAKIKDTKIQRLKLNKSQYTKMKNDILKILSFSFLNLDFSRTKFKVEFNSIIIDIHYVVIILNCDSQSRLKRKKRRGMKCNKKV